MSFRSVLIFVIIFSKSLIFAQSTANNFTSSNLPIVIINTNGQEILDSPRINAHMGIIYNGEGSRNQITDSLNNYDGRISIEIRGATSQSFPKKQYSLETQDSLGNNNNVSLLGMPKENDWILNAPYSDKSLIRNVLQYSLANDLGWYASRTKFCELVLNDEYIGIYVLTEKIKRDKKRVNISKLTELDNGGDSLTGGYIIKLDKDVGDNIAGWHSSFPKNFSEGDRIFYQYHYPKENDITDMQKNYIQQFMFDFESSMNSKSYSNTNDGYYKYINVDSFVDYFILSEFSKNIDAYRLSTYMYKDRDDKNGKLTIGPIWDFNIAFGNADYLHGFSTAGWYRDSYYGGNYQIPFWWDKLFSDTTFVAKVKDRWSELRNTKLSDEKVYVKIDSLTTLLSEASVRNFTKWPILGHYIWPNYFIGNSYLEEISYLKNWIKNRTRWIDANIYKNILIDSTTIEDIGEYALKFDGIDDFVNCGNTDLTNVTGTEITLEAWIKPKRWKEKSWEGVIISKDQFGMGEDHGYVLRCGDNGQVDLVLGDGIWHEAYSPKNLMNLNEWYHVAATYDGTRMKIFINGEEVVRKYDSFSIKGTNNHLFIGSSPADNSRSFNGEIDDVRIWEKARSKNQIADYMYSNLNNNLELHKANGLVAYYKFNEGSTHVTKDVIGNNKGAIGLLFRDDNHDPEWVENNDSPIVSVNNQNNSLSNKFHLEQNYPNPFNPTTEIRYGIPKQPQNSVQLSKISLTIFDILGRKAKTLVDDFKQAGNYFVKFDASTLPSGIYFYQLQAGDLKITKKMLLLK